MSETKEVSFVTKKALLTFRSPVCFMVDGQAVYTGAAIVEHSVSEVAKGSDRLPSMFRVVALPNNQPLKKSITVTVGYTEVVAMVDLED
jgi:hypothetical protein